MGTRAPGSNRAEITTSGSPGRISLLGIGIDCIRLPDLLGTVVAAARERRRTTVLYVNVHCMNLSRRNDSYRRILNAADIVYCDGTGVHVASWLVGQPLPERMTGADWIDSLCERMALEGLSLFLFGGPSRVAEEAATALTRRHPGLKIAGTAAGFGVSDRTVEAINGSGASVLLVGMGSPRQEEWIAGHSERLQVPVVWAVGALFEFVSGRLPRGPRWMTDHGLEWLCRLYVEPRKLWRRYLIGNPAFFWWLVRYYGVKHLVSGVGHSVARED